MNNSINERIKAVQVDSGLSVRKFAETIGIAQPSAKAILDGDNAPSYKAISGILIGFPDISAEWLLRGEGEMHSVAKLVTTPPEKDEPTSIGEAYYNKMIQQMEEHMKEIENRMDNIENKVS